MSSRAESIARRTLALSVGLVLTSLGAGPLQGTSVGGTVFAVAAVLAFAGGLFAIPSPRVATYGLICTVLVPSIGAAYLLTSRVPQSAALPLVLAGVAAFLAAIWPARGDSEAPSEPRSSGPSSPRGPSISLPPSSRPSNA